MNFGNSRPAKFAAAKHVTLVTSPTLCPRPLAVANRLGPVLDVRPRGIRESTSYRAAAAVPMKRPPFQSTTSGAPGAIPRCVQNYLLCDGKTQPRGRRGLRTGY